MDLKELLEKYPLLNVAELARLMYPDNKSSRSRLANKLNENIGQRITPKDVEAVKVILEQHAKELLKDVSKLTIKPK